MQLARPQPAQSSGERAYGAIKQDILENRMPAGAQYLEAELAERLQMSRTPLREALVRLANEGFIEIKPRHGIRVLPLSPEDMREIYQILTDLEATAARLVALHGLGPDALARLEAAVAEMDRALAEKDLPAWAKADEDFHSALVEHCGNRRLKSVVDTYRDQAHRARMQTLKLRPLPTRSNEDHRALVEAIKLGEAALAHAIHRRHRQLAGEMLVSLLSELGFRQL